MPTGWKFPPAVRRQLEMDTSGKSVVHLFGGKATFGVRLDVDPATNPDVVGDAWVAPFARESFDVVILDPPYFTMSSQIKTALFRVASWIARERVIWFHTHWMAPAGGLKYERGWLVRVGDNCAARVLQYFSIKARPGPATWFDRGPAMKYNRWLAQPNSLGLTEDSDGTKGEDSPGTGTSRDVARRVTE